MERIILGRTGLSVSRMALGCGGFSKIGLGTGKNAAESMAVVRQALNQGINLIDTAEAYGTETMVGQALQGWPRDEVIFSSKASVKKDGQLKTARQLAESLENSLVRLRTDYIDLYHLHAVRATDYTAVRQELVPLLLQLKQQGKIRFIGITEAFSADTNHRMLSLAVADDCWDVQMVGFNLLNQSARPLILHQAQAKNIGILDMFAVRRVLVSGQRLAAQLAELADQGLVDRSELDFDHPLEDLMADSDCRSLTELAYRFCCSEPGIHTILSGTGNLDHLRENIRSVAKGPLPGDIYRRLIALFARVDCISGQ